MIPNGVLVADIGGTHARFAVAEIADGHVRAINDEVTLTVADYLDLVHAWRAYAARINDAMPRHASFSIAGPVQTGAFKCTNNHWVIDDSRLNGDLGLEDHLLINDFVAVGHAVAQASEHMLLPLTGPDRPLPQEGTISIVGPGTGLGVAHVWRDATRYRVQHTEGGHIAFAPEDAVEDAILTQLRSRYGRVSAERVVSGPGIVPIYETLVAAAGQAPALSGDRAIWAAAFDGVDDFAMAALNRFCAVLGGVAGDIALAQGGSAVVIAGGLGLRLRAYLQQSDFAARFCNKGRYRDMLAAMPVKLITQEQPGLYGAAAAYAQRIVS